MTFTVEDGTGIANANSLCAVAFADTYFADRGIAAWTGNTSTVKEPALIRATDYIETRFGMRFKGEKAEDTQSLSWPRVYVDADDTVPIGVKKAVAEYALRALTTILAPDYVTDESNRLIKSKREKVGPIEQETVFVDGASVFTFRKYPAADALLMPWLISNNFVIRA